MENKIMKKLSKKMQGKDFHLVIMGSGYVGLTSAALFADAGFTITATDINPEIIKNIDSDTISINEPGLQELVSRNVLSGKLQALLNSNVKFEDKDAIIISTQTPIDENNKPNLSFLMKAVETVGKNLKRHMIVTICSTLPPRTMHEKIKPTLECLSDLKADTDFYLAYVPERIAPGRALKEFVESPRLVGGIGPNSTKAVAKMFRRVCKKIIETDAATAEVAKTAENTFRDVNIAFANQLALICEQYGVDITTVIELANTHPRVNIHTPGPGVGGPCLTKDPYLLTHGTKLAKRGLIKAARRINDYMPQHVVELTQQALRRERKHITNSRIAILGTAYKADVEDSRFSPSEPIIKKLITLGAETIAYDPYCQNVFGAKKATSLHEAAKETDCLVIVTDHTEFKSLNLPEIKKIMNERPIIVDGKRIINPYSAEKIGFTYYGIGYGARRGKDIMPRGE
jgi:UDP-N-acetyl-D-mannosaminuronic acid dehydrogenase